MWTAVAAFFGGAVGAAAVAALTAPRNHPEPDLDDHLIGGVLPETNNPEEK